MNAPVEKEYYALTWLVRPRKEICEADEPEYGSLPVTHVRVSRNRFGRQRGNSANCRCTGRKWRSRNQEFIPLRFRRATRHTGACIFVAVGIRRGVAISQRLQ